MTLLISLLLFGSIQASSADSAATVAWFQKTEQALMDAVAAGDKSVSDRALDDSCIYTTEEGQVLTRATDTFRRSGSEWKMIASHQSVITADPPAQSVSKAGWSRLTGDYRLMPDGWTFHVVLREGTLLGGRDPDKLSPLVPLASNVFVRSGALGELIFAIGSDGSATRIVELRKFPPLISTRVSVNR